MWLISPTNIFLLAMPVHQPICLTPATLPQGWLECQNYGGRGREAYRTDAVHGLAVIVGMGDGVSMGVPQAAAGGPDLLPLLLLQRDL